MYNTIIMYTDQILVLTDGHPCPLCGVRLDSCSHNRANEKGCIQSFVMHVWAWLLNNVLYMLLYCYYNGPLPSRYFLLPTWSNNWVCG